MKRIGLTSIGDDDDDDDARSLFASRSVSSPPFAEATRVMTVTLC